MCGIAGFIGEDAPGQVERMLAAERHRGPDGAGAFTDSPARLALGHTRLAILDLSERGRQPMTSPCGRYTLVFNGEIFNYLELRAELGGEFRTRTDTEVLLRALSEWGVERTLPKLAGMFAFGLWDGAGRVLVLARDRVGEKPLVYFEDGHTFAFASELKALSPLAARRVDPEALDAFLALGYIPAPLAIYKNCRKLEAGHWLRFESGRIDIRRWWRPEELDRDNSPIRKHRIHELRERMRESVQIRLRADVPIALLLSGGVDSSAIAAECAGLGTLPQAFTVSFDSRDRDLPHACSVARALGLPHEVLRADAEGALRGLPDLYRAYDEPFADSSAIPALALARALEGRYKVVLTGDGGDEAFGGYRHYEFIGAKQTLKKAAAAMGLLDGRNPSTVYVQSKSTFRGTDRARFLNGHACSNSLDRILSADPYLAQPRRRALERAMWSDRHLYLPNDLTYKMDIALSRCGIEGRAPFLDHRVLEWAQSLPASDLVAGRQKKVLLREAYRGDLPGEILARPKQGFGAPVEEWLAGPLRTFTHDVLPCPLLEKKAQAGWTGQQLWTLMSLAGWAAEWKAGW